MPCAKLRIRVKARRSPCDRDDGRGPRAIRRIPAPFRFIYIDVVSEWNGVSLRLPGKSSILRVLALVGMLLPAKAEAVKLKEETLQAWDEYVQAADAGMQRRLSHDGTFLWIDEEPGRASKVRGPAIVVTPAGPHIPRKVPSGLIHDWIGATFIPGATIQDVVPILRDYGRYKEFYHPNVIASRSVSTGDSQDRFSIVLMSKTFFLKTALDSDYRASYAHIGDRRMYSISRTTRVQEITGYGTAGQRMLPENEGKGLIWSLHSILRFEERDGGLYIEVEAIVLSRDIPAGLRWLAEPIVRRVSRDSLTTALRQTEQAVHLVSAQAGGGVQ